ncbi:hypothetical protein ACDQ55_21165 [Chitinophaga sp. 30R24]|uniref:hypothetical protein n=1 Tax=Chitinophaga sp. 30R24 TaxID=3248838 RepID=UPI003B904A28
MKYRYGWISLALLALSCQNSPAKQLQQLHDDKDNGLVQEKRINNTVVTCSYLPAGWERKMSDEPDVGTVEGMSFEVNITSADKADLIQKGSHQMASYGLDTVFQLIYDQDTLPPLLAQRVANGNVGGIVYLVTFDRRTLEQGSKLTFVYKDWLFTATRLTFPLQINLLQQSDSLSLKL